MDDSPRQASVSKIFGEKKQKKIEKIKVEKVLDFLRPTTNCLQQNNRKMATIVAEQKQRLRDLVEANAQKIPVLEAQLLRLQRELDTSNDVNPQEKEDDTNPVKAVEVQLQAQSEEWRRENERQLKAMDNIQRKISQLQQNSASSEGGFVDLLKKWSKKLSPIMLLIIIYMVMRRRR